MISSASLEGRVALVTGGGTGIGAGQRHIDLAARALQGGFVPYSVGQLGIDFRPTERM